MINTIILLLFLTQYTFSHNGRLNGEGCHNMYKNGTYHCHRSKTQPNNVDIKKDSKPKENKSKENETKPQNTK